MSPEEALFYLGAAAFFLPPLIVLLIAARAARRSPWFAAFALLGWVGMAVGLALIFATADRPRRQPPP